MRLVITGNGGSGKTWLGEQIARRASVPLIRLDDVYWAGAYGGEGRDKPTVFCDVQALADGEAWIIEGIYGWLLPAALPRATHFVFNDLPLEDCLANLRARGEQGGGDAAAFQTMLDWVAGYPIRSNVYSRSHHRGLWDQFAGNKILLADRADVTRCAADWPGPPDGRL